LIISVALHVLTAILAVLTGVLAGFGYLYWAGCLVFLALLVYQHLIVKPGDLSRVNRAFGTTNGIASVIFAAFVIAGLFVS
jgi:4-hydroxybenzoate polyprenyltransferase